MEKWFDTNKLLDVSVSKFIYKEYLNELAIWMDIWMDGLDGWMDGLRMNGYMDGLMDGWTGG